VKYVFGTFRNSLKKLRSASSDYFKSEDPINVDEVRKYHSKKIYEAHNFLEEGMPIIEPQDIYGHNIDHVRELQALSQCNSDYEFELTYGTVIKNLSMHAHMLPASRNWHHEYPGGLFEHSLEVAIFALRNFNASLIESSGYIDKDRKRKISWRMAIFIAAMCHDVGKLVDLYVVYDMDNPGCRWNPLDCSLYHWAKKNNVKKYRIDWNPHTSADGHKEQNLVIYHRIAPSSILKMIHDDFDNLPKKVVTSIRCRTQENFQIYDIVSNADMLSTERSRETIYDRMYGRRKATDVDKYIKILTELACDKWQSNLSNNSAEVYVFDNECYMKFPEVLKSIADQVQHRNLKLSSDHTTILNRLIEAQFIVARKGDNSRESYIWMVRPGTSKSRAYIKALRVTSATYLYGKNRPPPSIPGDVLTPQQFAEQEEAKKLAAAEKAEAKKLAAAEKAKAKKLAAAEQAQGDTQQEGIEQASGKGQVKKPVAADQAQGDTQQEGIEQASGKGQVKKPVAADQAQGDTQQEGIEQASGKGQVKKPVAADQAQGDTQQEGIEQASGKGQAKKPVAADQARRDTNQASGKGQAKKPHSASGKKQTGDLAETKNFANIDTRSNATGSSVADISARLKQQAQPVEIASDITNRLNEVSSRLGLTRPAGGDHPKTPATSASSPSDSKPKPKPEPKRSPLQEDPAHPDGQKLNRPQKKKTNVATGPDQAIEAASSADAPGPDQGQLDLSPVDDTQIKTEAKTQKPNQRTKKQASTQKQPDSPSEGKVERQSSEAKKSNLQKKRDPMATPSSQPVEKASPAKTSSPKIKPSAPPADVPVAIEDREFSMKFLAAIQSWWNQVRKEEKITTLNSFPGSGDLLWQDPSTKKVFIRLDSASKAMQLDELDFIGKVIDQGFALKAGKQRICLTLKFVASEDVRCLRLAVPRVCRDLGDVPLSFVLRKIHGIKIPVALENRETISDPGMPSSVQGNRIVISPSAKESESEASFLAHIEALLSEAIELDFENYLVFIPDEKSMIRTVKKVLFFLHRHDKNELKDNKKCEILIEKRFLCDLRDGVEKKLMTLGIESSEPVT
jgi:hypothetical protein